ncbi:MAG: HEPN domain-containing protein [Candidatus Micrarchaeota archaeon]|nr:HEPN domain-containing protein [Candidatus Micrarchaeota archaeon]
MAYTSEECFKSGMLRRIPQARRDAEEELKAAAEWLGEAEKNIKIEAYKSAIISSYNSMFHAARSILIRDGVRERSHFCVARYLEDSYAKKGLLEKKWVELLDFYREMRHEDQYTTTFVATEKDAKGALAAAREFAGRMKALMESG